MSLREKVIFFGIIVALFGITLFVYIFPAEKKLKSDDPVFIILKSPHVACSTLDNYKNMLSFSDNQDYDSANKYFDTKKCERLEAGTEVRVINMDYPDIIIVKPVDRPIHLYISSAISNNQS